MLAMRNGVAMHASGSICAEPYSRGHVAQPDMTNTTGSRSDRQLPAAGEIFLDHVGHFVRDADAARAALVRAGFTATEPSLQVHPDPAGGAPQLTGTGNVTAMLRRGYVEVLFRTAETPLAAELDAAVARHPGVHLVAFAVADAAAAHGRLAAAGFPVRPLVTMQRPVATPTGRTTAAFTIARVAPGAMPEGRIQILTHHSEQAVWQPHWLAHGNGARALIDLVIAVADPEEAGQRFACFTGRGAIPTRFGQAIALDRGGIHLVTASAFAALLPGTTMPALPFAGAYGLGVDSLADAERSLRRAGCTVSRDGQAVIAGFPPELGSGAWVLVEAAADLPWRR
jgi:hypothetical protein